RLFETEGWASAATVYEATGEAVAVAFNAGNLTAVARAFRERFGSLEIVIVADDDYITAGNPGRKKGFEAARAGGAKVTIPRFHNLQSRGNKDTDFNDLARLEGLEETRRQLFNAQELPEAVFTDAEGVVETLSTKPALSDIENAIAAIASVEGPQRRQFL